MATATADPPKVTGSDQLSFNVGGKRPSGSSLRIVGGRVEVEGQYEKGQKLRVEMLVEVRSIEFRDEVDEKTGQVVGCERRHKASVVGPPKLLDPDDA